MHTGIPEPTRLKVWYSMVVRFRMESGKMSTKVTNADMSNFAAESWNILYVDSVM